MKSGRGGLRWLSRSGEVDDRRGVRRDDDVERERDLDRDSDRESERDRDLVLDLDLDLYRDRDRDRDWELYCLPSSFSSWLPALLLRGREDCRARRIERLRPSICGDDGDGSRSSLELCSALPSLRLRLLEADSAGLLPSASGSESGVDMSKPSMLRRAGFEKRGFNVPVQAGPESPRGHWLASL